ncbi:hypothetical protein JCM10450v2_005307 [Rhodotorula kratochvilovae]
MAKVRQYRRFTHEGVQANQVNAADPTTAAALHLEAPTRSSSANVDSDPSKRRRTSSKQGDVLDNVAQCTPVTSSSSLLELVAAAPAAPVPSGTASSSRLALSPSPPLSLATLPLDILERIGELLVPVFVPAKPHGVRSISRDWLDPAADLARFSSTCKAAWAASRPLIGRVYGCDARTGGDTPPTLADHLMAQMRVEQRLKSILDREAATSYGDLPYHVPASKIRHFYLGWDSADALAYPLEISQSGEPFSTTATLLAGKLSEMTRLETLALAWRDEVAVTATSPYSVFALPADILIAIAAHPTLRELYLCGIKITRRFSNGDTLLDVPPLPPQLRTLTLNACHDSALELVTLALGATEVRVHRDFCVAPRVAPDCFWDQDVWRRAEEVEMVGFSGAQGVPLLQRWRSDLEILRSLTPPPFIPLRTLRLCEPFVLSDVRTSILPALAHLPQLRHLTIFVWHSRDFGPALLADVHGAMPELEELGIALDSEALAWWPGSLSAYAPPLARFRSLRTFTWNYSPYADLTPTSMRSYALPLVARALLPPLPALAQLRWFGEEVYCRPLDVDAPPSAGREWAWSDDERVRPVTEPWMRAALAPPPEPAGDVRAARLAAQEAEAAAAAAREAAAAAREAVDPFCGAPVAERTLDDVDLHLWAHGIDPDRDYVPSSSSSSAAAAPASARTTRAAAQQEDGQEDEAEGASSSSAGAFEPVGAKKRKPRRSMLEQLVAARAEEAGASAKGKGKARAGEGEAEDAAFW